MRDESRSESTKPRRRTRPDTLFAFFLALIFHTGLAGFHWWRFGYDQTAQGLNQDYAEQADMLSVRNHSLAEDSRILFSDIKQKIADWRQTSGEKLLALTDAHTPEAVKGFFAHNDSDNFSGKLFQAAWTHIKEAGFLFVLVFAVVTLKLFNLFAPVLLYLLAGILGLLDGLLRRYIRTVEGGRDSTYLFNRLTAFLLYAPLLLISIYLLLPFAINPIAVSLLLAMCVFSTGFFFASNLKKFL